MEMKTKWDFSPLLNKDFSEEKKEMEEAYLGFRDKWKSNPEYLEKAEVLKEALEEYEKLAENYNGGGSWGYYYHLRDETEQDDTEVRAKFGEVDAFFTNIGNEIRFFGLNLGKVSKEKQKEFLESGLLKDYRHFLEKLFEEAKYFLSEEEEKILSLKSRASYELWAKMISSLLSKEIKEVHDEEGNKVSKTYAELLSLMRSKDKKIRDESAKAFNDILDKYSDVAEFELNAILENKKVNDELRKLTRPDEIRHVSDDIGTEVVDSLIESVSSKGNEISKKYYELKSKLLGLKKMKYYEKNTDYGEINKEFSYEKSVEIVKNVFSNLDKKFGEIFQEFLDNGQIDAFPRKGKRSGAFCSNGSIKLPTYIMLNHTNKLNDVLTIAHEAGHGINSELMREKQNALNFELIVSTAEVASTFMEDFVLQELLKNTDDEERISIMIHKLDDDISTIQRQVACYKFELDIHEAYKKNGYLSKEKIGEIFRKNMENYLGEYVDCSEAENWWIYWPHIREYFYVYSYASGLLISKAMQKKVKEDPEFIEKVKEFLSAGTSDSPENIFMKMGIDITDKKFWENGLDEIANLLNETEELTKKLGKI